MFKTVQDINLEELKKNYARLYYFGLGFIQLKIDETWRLHFYHPKLPAFVEEPHNHRYDFTSKVLQGTLVNTQYKLVYSEPWDCKYAIRNESCDPDKPARFHFELINLDVGSVDEVTTGDSYSMDHRNFHTVTTKDNCITLLNRGPYTKDFAQVIRALDKEKVCPFAQKVDEDELWKLMEDMLSGKQ